MSTPIIPDAQAPLVCVTERPEGMSYEAYKELQRQQDRLLKARKKGTLVHLSDGYVQLPTTTGQTVLARQKKTYRKPQPPNP